MNVRLIASLSVCAIVSWSPVPTSLAAQTPSATEPAKNWTQPRTPDGQPDLQGYWTSLSFTPMERPAKYGTREFLTDEEMAEVFRAGVKQSYEFTFSNSAETPVYDATIYGLDAWQNGVKPNRRTSLVVDPPDGRIPALTEEAKGRSRARVNDPKFQALEDLGLGVRCLVFGGPPILPAAYNNNTRIVQAPGYVMLEYEWGSTVRIIPLDGRPHLSPNIQSWHGDSRGRWEGTSLVVETVNFRPGATFRNANPRTLRIIERFTRLDDDTIEYRFTIDDATTWTRPWTAIVPMNRVEGPMFEYACHEGNNALVLQLEGSRTDKETSAEVPAKEAR